MSGALRFQNTELLVKSRMLLGDKLIVRQTPMSSVGRTFDKIVFWEGWAWEERLLQYVDPDTRATKPGWLKSGLWKRVDILATAFNEGPRWYEVPPHHVVKGIVLVGGPELVLKVLTRESRGNERPVKPRFTLTGPQRIFSQGTREVIETPF